MNRNIVGNVAGTSSTSKKGKDKIKEVAKEKPTKNLKKLKVGESSKGISLERRTKEKHDGTKDKQNWFVFVNWVIWNMILNDIPSRM